MQLFRPIIALVGSLVVFVAFLMGKIDTATFMTFIMATVIYWFRARDEDKK